MPLQPLAGNCRFVSWILPWALVFSGQSRSSYKRNESKRNYSNIFACVDFPKCFLNIMAFVQENFGPDTYIGYSLCYFGIFDYHGLLKISRLTSWSTFWIKKIYYTWTEAFLVGSILSCTDIFSFIQRLRKHGTPQKIISLIEGESLINYCICVLIFQMINVQIIVYTGNCCYGHVKNIDFVANSAFYWINFGRYSVWVVLCSMCGILSQENHLRWYIGCDDYGHLLLQHLPYCRIQCH